MKKTLYIQIDGDYYPMKRLEWEEGEPGTEGLFIAMYDDEFEELLWVQDVVSIEEGKPQDIVVKEIKEGDTPQDVGDDAIKQG